MIASLKKTYQKNKGMYDFFLRTVVFFAVILGFQLFVMLYFRHTSFFLQYLQLGSEFYFDFLTGLRKRDVINAVLFSAIIFIIWNRRAIQDFKSYKQSVKESLLFGVLAIASQVLHYVFKAFVRTNYEWALSQTLLLTIVKYCFNLAFIVLVALAVYNLSFVKSQYPRFKKQIPVFVVMPMVYFFIIQLFQSIWRVLGDFVARTLYITLGWSFDNVYLDIEATRAPILGVGEFIVGISEECSGIDSMLLFLSLFTVLLVLDWNRLNRKRMFMLLIPGILGTVLYNLLRIYLLMLVGIFISPEFAIDMFHSNIGWILFLVFFIVFWHFGSKWVYEKSDGKKEKVKKKVKKRRRK